MDIEKVKKLSYNELLDYCKEINHNTLTKQKKTKAQSTLIKELTKLLKQEKMDEIKTEVKQEQDIINEIIWRLEEDVKNDNEEYLKNKAFMNNIISRCHQMLYSHSISGRKAQADIMKILSIIALNNLIKNENINIDKLIEEKEIKLGEEKIDNYKSYLGDLIKIIDNEMIFNEWKKFISLFVYPLFPTIIDNQTDTTFNIKDEYVLRDLIRILNDISKNSYLSKDLSIICGDIYEYFLHYGGKGGGSKELGQFFTPRILIDIFLNVCGVKELIDTYENPKIYDCCMGSGGFLSRTYISNNINPENIYGNDYEDDIYKIAQSSLTILTKLGKINISKCNSLSPKNNKFLMDNDLKFDVVLTNPPFATKITNMKDIENMDNFDEIYPVKTSDGISMFIQMIMYKLKEGGICGIVLPDGKLLNSNQKAYLDIRKFIVKNARVLKIINAEGDIFENTGIKTTFLLFQKGDYDNYNHKTEFYEILNKGTEVKLLGKSNLNKDLQFKFDMSSTEEQIKYRSDIEVKTLGELCEFIGSGKPIKKENRTGTLYPYIASSSISGYVNEYLYDGYYIILAQDGTIGTINIYNGKFYPSNHTHVVKISNDITLKYTYYYLKTYNFTNLITGLIPKLTQENLKSIKIPIPPLELQEELVEYLDGISEINEDNKNKIQKLKRTNELYLNLSISFNEFGFIKFGEIFNLIKGTIQSSKVIEDENGEGVMITQSTNKDDYKKIKNWKIDGNNLFIGNIDSGRKFVIRFYNGKCDYTNLLSLCKLIDDYKSKINNRYIYYYLLSIKDILTNNYLKGCANKSLDIEKFNNLKIPIPSLEVQNKIVEYLDNKNKIINDLEKEIDENQKEMSEFMKNSLV